MRFKNYLLKDNNIKKFRSLQIKLVDINTDHKEIVNFIGEKYQIDLDIDKILLDFNNRLKNIYKGKYKFDLCLDEGILPEKLKKLNKKQINDIKADWYRINDEFAKIQKVFEKHLQNNLGGK